MKFLTLFILSLDQDLLRAWQAMRSLPFMAD